MYQWKTSSVIYATSILPGTNLSISQLLRVERHRGSNYAALCGPPNEQCLPALGHGFIDQRPRTFSQDDKNFPAVVIPAANAKMRTNLDTLQIPVHNSPHGLVYTACKLRPIQYRNSRIEGYSSTGKIHRRHASQTAGLKDGSKNPFSTHTGSSHSRLPQLAPKKPTAGCKAPIKLVKQADDAFREVELGETTRAWPMSTEERKAEAKIKEEARLLKEAQEKKAREAQEGAVRRHREEQLRNEAEAIRRVEALALRAKALALEQKNDELREKWMARLLASANSLERVAVQADNIRSQIEELLDQSEAARRELWEKKAKTVEMVTSKVLEEKELYSNLFARYSHSSTLLCAAIGEFCMAVGADVHGQRLTSLVNDLEDFDRNNFLPRYMFAENDTPHRTARLCAIFWIYERLKNFEEEMSAEAHTWRHLRSARKLHALHPDAFAYKPVYAEWYCRARRFVTGTSILQADYEFWNNHTELVKLPVSSRQQRRPDMNAKTTRRNDLVFLLKAGATEISRELSRMLDQGNFDLGRGVTDFKRQQQIALRKPFTHVLEKFRETEHLLVSFVLLLRDAGTRRAKMDRFIENMKGELRSREKIVRYYLAELEILTYWNWLATERHIPQKRMSYRRINQLSTIEANPPKDKSTPAFHRTFCTDQTWRYNNFRGPNGQYVVIDYCVTDQFAERTAKLFVSKSVIGIDLWGGRQFANIEDAVREGNSAKRCVPMIAIASEERIALFHLASMWFNHYTPHLPTLIRILEDPAISKVGENTQAFRQRLSTYMGISMVGAVDLKSMYAGPFRSSHKDGIINSYPALATYSGPSTVYPPEPLTTVTLSDELKKHIGQSLGDDTVNCEELQIPSPISSPKLMQLSASRPYAALHLHHILKHRMQPASHQPSAQVVRSKTSKIAEFNPSLNQANENEITTFMKMKEAASGSSNGRVQRAQNLGLATAEHDLGPTNIDPWFDEGARDSQLKKLATLLAKTIQNQIEVGTPIVHLTAYVLLTRFGQSCEDIYRILHIQEPADMILELVKATDLPLNETMFTLLEAEKESMQGSSPNTRAAKWIKKIIADAPVLLRMYRRSRTEFEAYAMWHRLEMSVAKIAQISRKPKEKIFRLIMKTLKLGNPPVFPFQRARYLSLLREYTPKDYAKEIERTIDEAPLHAAPWGATRDVLLITGLESFDEGDLVGYTTGLDDAMSPPTFGDIKRLKPVNQAKATKAAKVAKAAKMSKVTKTAKATKTVKPTPVFRSKVLSLGEVSRSKKKIRQAYTLESVSAVQPRPAKSSQAPPRGLLEKVSKPAIPRKGVTPTKRIVLEKGASSSKKIMDSKDMGWLQATAVWTRTENSTIDPGTAKMEDPVQQPKVSENSWARRRRRRAATFFPENSSDTKAKAGRKIEKGSYSGREQSLNEDNNQERERRSLDADIPIIRVKSKNKFHTHVTKTESSEVHSLHAGKSIRKYVAEGEHPISAIKTNSSEGQFSKPSLRFSMNKAPKKLSEPSASNLRQHDSPKIELAHGQKLPKGFMDLSRTVGGQGVARDGKQS